MESESRILTSLFLLLASYPQTCLPHSLTHWEIQSRIHVFQYWRKPSQSSPIFLSVMSLGLTLGREQEAEWVLSILISIYTHSLGNCIWKCGFNIYIYTLVTALLGFLISIANFTCPKLGSHCFLPDLHFWHSSPSS